MSRRGRRSNEAAVTLFPFLAVLICTMGSLIVLLVVMVQQAKMQARREVAAKNATKPIVAKVAPPPVPTRTGPTEEEVRAAEDERDRLLWEIEQMKVARTQTLASIQQERDELSHVEDHTRRLQAQVEEMQQEAKRIADLRNQSVDSNTADAVAIEQLRSDVAKARQSVAELAQGAGNKSTAYIIIPYDGPGGTGRRPIYIECLADRVVIQPEGITLYSSDFENATDANNPLAVALRAVREHSDRLGMSDDNTRPYPLLIVRPSGAISFSACRYALKGWDDEFGYELVPEDTQLTYPTEDTALKETLQLAVEASRRQQEIRSQLLTARLANKAPEGFRASRSGGFVRAAPSAGVGGTRRESGAAATGSSANSFGAQGDQPNESVANATFSGAATKARHPGDSSAKTSSFNQEPRGDEWSPDDEVSGSSTEQTTASNGGPAKEGDAKSGDRRDSRSTSPNSSEMADNQPTTDDNIPRDYMSGIQGNRRGTATDGATGATAEGQADANGGGMVSLSVPQPMSQTLGKNWAVRRGTTDAIPITRPIQVRLEKDKVVLQPERRGQRPTVFRVESSTSEVVEPLVKAVWDRIDGWGTAGATMYWKPALEITVAPQGDRRYVELEALLQGSGLDWKRVR